MVALYYSLILFTISSSASTVPQTLLEYLPTEANTLSSATIETKQIQLPENAHLVAELLGIINQDIHLVGHNTTITPNKVERSLNKFQMVNAESQTDYHSKCDNSVAKSVSKRLFMLNLQNSTVHVRQVTIDNSERESSIFLVESSTVLFEEGKLVSCGLESPFVVVSSEESSSRFGSTIVVSSSEIVWKDDAQPPLVDTLSTSAAVSVFGSGLRLDSKILSSGTGPLFSFGLHPSTGEIVHLRPDSTTTTHLSACSLLNMSSSCASNCESLPSLKLGSCVLQTLVGCSLSRSSNHQSGTGMLDINMGGSLLCQNTTFSHCTHTSNSDEPEQYQHYISTDPPYTLPAGATSVAFILCTFKDMTYAPSDNLGGAAISLYNVVTTLSISQCFFHKCTVTASNNDGGAINYYTQSTTGTGLTLSDSSFADCASTFTNTLSSAGALMTSIPGQSTITNCFFDKCWAKGRGGAVYLRSTPFQLVNCAFVGCYSNADAGGLYLRNITSINMKYVQFRACTANARASSSDIATEDISTTTLNSTSIQFCDSTSGSPNIYNTNTTSSDGSLIPQVRPVTVASSSVKIVGTTATFSMTMSEKILAPMGVLLEGANVPRLVFLTFGTSTTPSTTATADFTLSSTTILPTLESGKKYTIRSWSFPYGQAGVDGVTGSTINPTTASIAISGYHFREGSYEMKVKTANQNELTLSLESPTFSSLSGKFGMSATESSKLRYAREYEVKSIVFNSTSLSQPTPLSFSIPYPSARLTTIAQVNSTDWLTLSFGGSGFVAESYIITLSGRDEDGQTHPTTITRAPTSLTALPVVNMSLYPLDEASLKFGMEYTITSMISTDTFHDVVLDVTSFSTIPEPARFTSLTLTRYDELDKTAFFSVEGCVLVEGAKYRINVLSSSSTAFCFNFTASSTTGGEGSAILFSADPLKVELDYDTAYTVSTVEDAEGAELILHSTFTFSTCQEPARIVGIKSRQLNDDRTKMFVTFEGRAFLYQTGKVNLTNGATTWESLSDVEIMDNTHCIAEFAVGEEVPSYQLKYGEEYTLKGSWTGSSGFHVEDGITIVVPFPPMITDLKIFFSNTLHTCCFVVLTGTDLIVGNSLHVTLNDSLSFIATITSETEARSSELLIGWPTTLQHSTTYGITSIEAMNEDDGETLFHYAISDTTASLPDTIIIFVDCGSTSDSTLFCGDRTRPCSSIEDGWKIVEGLGISTLSISILHNTTQKEQVKILSDHEVVIESGPSTRPELFVSPSSASSDLDGEGMIDVWGGRLRVHDVDVDLSDSPSLIFIRMVGGHLTIESSSFSTSSQLSHSEDSLCSWRGGAIVLDHSTTTITSTVLSGLSHGAIDMEGGSLKIETSTFHDNNPHSSSFPSLRRNIRCSEGGEIKIESLSGGDGMETPSAWISTSDCMLTAKPAIASSPFFVPTLSSSSTSKLNEPQKTLSLIIKGTTLIPCSLFLEVFEKQKDGKDGQNVQIALSPPVCTMFTETEHRLSLALSSLSTLDTSLEWRGRLVFGAGQTTTSSFVVKTAESESSEIVVDWKGSDNQEECGTDTTPCGTIAAGWEGGVTKMEDILTEICLTVSTQASFGGIVWVGNGAMKLTSKTGRTSRIVVEGTLRKEEGRAGNGVVNVDSGRVTFASLTLSLPSSSELDGVGKLSVVWGRGEIVVESVQLEHKTGMVGMGLICLVEGWLSLSAVESKWMEMGEGIVLLEGQSGNKEIVMKLSECTFANTLLHSTPFLSFSSSSPSSSLSISHSSFINMKSTLSPSSSLHPLLSVRTAQPEMAFESCSFENCGVFSSAGDSAGSTLQILRSSSSLSSCTISFSSCLFVGWFPAETSAGSVHIVVSSAVTRVKLDGTRFEHTQRSSALSPKRAGMLVEYPHSLPVVARSKAVFSSCSLCLRKISPTRN